MMRGLGIVSQKLLPVLPSVIFALASTPSLWSQTRSDLWRGRAPVRILDSDRGRDGIRGPVRGVRTEIARIRSKAGARVEGPRALLELTAYDTAGKRIENETYPVVRGTLGRETYEYDAQGQLLATVVRDQRGRILSRTFYVYEFDAAGNWVKMTSLRADTEAAGVSLTPLEVTYRTITYYSDEEIGATAPGGVSKTVEAKAPPVAGEVSSPWAEGVVDVGLINDKALNLPPPAYLVGRSARPAPIIVSVEVIIDVTGRVVAARAVEGPPLLHEAAEAAARRAGFFPFRVSGRPVRARGRLEYVFPFDPR